MIEIRENSPEGREIASCRINVKNSSADYNFDLPELKAIKNICFLFKGKSGDLLELDAFELK